MCHRKMGYRFKNHFLITYIFRNIAMKVIQMTKTTDTIIMKLQPETIVVFHWSLQDQQYWW